MKILTQFIAGSACLWLTGCLTTRVELGPETNGKTSEDKFTGLFSGPVDSSKHCATSGMAAVTIKRSFFGEDVLFDCGKKGTMAKAGTMGNPKNKMKKKRRKRMRQKKM